MGSRKRNSKKKAPESRWQSLLKKPWIFAGAAFGLDLAMLIAGMVLSAAKLPVDYTASGDSIVHSQPLAFFGVTAAVVVALLCVLIGLIIGGAFLKKRRAAQITGAAGLLIMSLAMVGSSAFMALGSPVRERIQRELLRRGTAAHNRGNRAVFRRVHRGFLPHRDRGRRKGGSPRRHRPQ